LEKRVWRKKSPGTEEESGESEYDAAAAMELLDVGAAGKG
jgi:hypothetical protein